jgi:hypothetical protein
MEAEELGKWIREITDYTIEIAAKCRDYETIMSIQNKSISALAQRVINLEKENEKIRKEMEQISLLN